MDSRPAMIAKRIILAENKNNIVFRIVDFPDKLDEEETSIKFQVKNPLAYDLDGSKILIDFDGHFQFKDGKRNQYTTHHKQISSDFKAYEKKDFLFSLVPSDLQKEKGHFGFSIMFLGYYATADIIVPVYAFWKMEW